jgi:hypothetical protein
VPEQHEGFSTLEVAAHSIVGQGRRNAVRSNTHFDSERIITMNCKQFAGGAQKQRWITDRSGQIGPAA